MSPSKDTCKVRFYYNLHGCGAGNLTLIQEYQEEGHPPLKTEVKFCLNLKLFCFQWPVAQGQGEGGSNVDEWRRHTHNLASGKVHRVIFEASVGEKKVREFVNS